MFKHCHRWIKAGSIDNVFIACVQRLDAAPLLDVKVLHGDGTATVAKKGGDNLGYNGHKPMANVYHELISFLFTFVSVFRYGALNSLLLASIINSLL